MDNLKSLKKIPALASWPGISARTWAWHHGSN